MLNNVYLQCICHKDHNSLSYGYVFNCFPCVNILEDETTLPGSRIETHHININNDGGVENR